MRKLLFALLLLTACGREPETTCCTPTKKVDKSKDPVCGMWVVPTDPQTFNTKFDNAIYYFCAESCRETFDRDPLYHVKACNCKKYKRNCDCDHCQGKQVPCDCGK